MKKIFAIIAAVCLMPAASYAGLYVEPYLGYLTGSYEGKGSFTVSNVEATATNDEDLSGLGFGARLGWSMSLLAIGVDYMKTSIEGEEDSATTDYDTTDVGVFVAVDLPVMFRFFATYIFQSKFEGDASGSKVNTEGSGFKAGVGFTGLPLVSINLEMYTNSHDEGDFDGTDFTTADFEAKATMLSVSIPLNL